MISIILFTVMACKYFIKLVNKTTFCKNLKFLNFKVRVCRQDELQF